MLEIDNVAVRFGGLVAVDAVSLRVAVGERHAVIGPNGAGKSTLFNAVAGLVAVNAGRVRLAGTDITTASVPRRARLGLGRTFQITTLFPSLTIAETMRLGLYGCSWRPWALLGRDRPDAAGRAAIAAAIAACGLKGRGDATVAALSYGAQRQLELALALVGAPRLLLLDEPAAGLSPAERTLLAQIIAGLPRSLTVLMIEHDMDLVLSLVDRITCLDSGRTIADGTPDSIRTDPEVRRVYLGTPHVRA